MIRVDAERIGMLGMSFGGYRATRMAATDNRLRAIVANGAPNHRSFKAGRNIGTPEIFIHTLTQATHADSPRDLLAKLQALSLACLPKRDIVAIRGRPGHSSSKLIRMTVADAHTCG